MRKMIASASAASRNAHNFQTFNAGLAGFSCVNALKAALREGEKTRTLLIWHAL